MRTVEAIGTDLHNLDRIGLSGDARVVVHHPDSPSADPDAALMLNAKFGDQAAFERLYESYRPKLINVFRQAIGDHHEIEDLVQEVFVRAYRARSRYVQSAKFATWLFTIARNAVHNIHRTRRRARVQSWQLDSSALPQHLLIDWGSDQQPDVVYARNELRHAVRVALQELPDTQRIAIDMQSQGASYAEIGQVLGISPIAVKSRISRGRDRLRSSLEKTIWN